MVVSSDPHDKTWQIHLNALLILLHQNFNDQNFSDQNSNRMKGSPLQNVFQFLSSQNIREIISPLPLSSCDKASLLLDITKLALRRLNNEFNKIFSNISPPRKLDVQKLRRSIKEVHDNLLLISSMLGKDQSIARWEDTPTSLRHLVYKTLTLITSTLILKTTTFLERNSTSRTPKTPSPLELNCLIQRQVEGIYISTSSLISTIRNSTSNTSKSCPSRPGAWRGMDLYLLGTIWPLYSASQFSNNATMLECTKKLLWDIGVHENIPIALILVSLC
jgi:hypothetical protein